ncbi:MAG TPA: hypothetical protein DCP08_02035 [Chloroflexi bacterium]|nr:hypothetical protein [Chloroflexota bacterium]
MSGNKMRVGLLWFDDDPKKEVSLKVKEAAQRYLEKFGRRPNVCYVSPATLPLPLDPPGPAGIHLDGLRVLSSPLVLPDHFWVGEGHQSKEKEGGLPKVEVDDQPPPFH